jgi:hypothetical protein
MNLIKMKKSTEQFRESGINIINKDMKVGMKMVWKQRETPHYRFNYQNGTTAERDIEKIAEYQENCYECICDFLQVRMDRRIEYYLCESPVTVGELYGDNDPCNGFAREPAEIVAVYNDNVKCIGYHEDAHIISYNTLSKPKQNFIREGLAMYFDRVWWGIPNYAWVQVYIEKKIYPEILKLMNREVFFNYSDIITYPIAGAFTEYIICAYGIEKYKAFYLNVGDNVDKDFMDVYGISLDVVEGKFIKYIKNIRNAGEIIEMIHKLLVEKSILT